MTVQQAVQVELTGQNLPTERSAVLDHQGSQEIKSDRLSQRSSKLMRLP